MQQMIQSTIDIGQHIQSARKKQGLSQEELAMLANVGRRFVVRLEQGKATAQVGKVLQVLHALGLQVQVVSTWDSSS